MFVKRAIQDNLEKALFTGKIVILYGARQVGKTTLVRAIGEKYGSSVYLNCDEPDIRSALTDKTSTELKSFVGSASLVILDEAQRVKNIGLTLKLFADTFPEIQIIATGSSSFELSGEIAEPLTGRKEEFFLYPFSLDELSTVYSQVEMNRLLEDWMVFGMYPGVIFDGQKREKEIREIATSYSYKDILSYQGIRNPDVLEKLLQALALQVGNEVSYTELAKLLDINKVTVESYIRILEQAYIIFRIGPFSRNIRNELRRNRKIYFFDLGMRNALINNLNPLEIRQDVGALWENFLITERLKRNSNTGRFVKSYFWRTTTGKEIDYVEDEGDVLSAYEFKWKKDRFSEPKEFLKAYSVDKISIINRENYATFLLKKGSE